MRPNGKVLARGSLSILLLAMLLTTWGSPADAAQAPPRIPGKPSSSQGNVDIRVQNAQKALELAAAHGVGRQQAASRAQAQIQLLVQGAAALTAATPSAQVRFSPVIGAPEVVRNPHGGLTAAAPGRAGIDVVRDFLHANKAVYGLSDAEIEALRFKGESASPKSGARMVRVDQVVNGIPVFQSDTRFLLDRSGRLVRAVGLLVPQASAIAPFPAARLSAAAAFTAAMKSVGIEVDATKVRIVGDVTPGHRGAVAAPETAQIKGPASTQLVYFPLAPGVLVPAWMQVTFTKGPGDWTTLVDATTGTLLWRKNIRSYASTQQARFSVYTQADGTTPADSPAPQSPTTAAPGAQFPEIARTIVNMLTTQTAASPNGWIPDGGSSTTGQNVDAYLDTDDDDAPDTGLLDNNGRPVGNVDANTNNRDFLGTGYAYTPAPQGGNPNAGTSPTDTQFQRGAVTHLFYLTNWYHDRLASFGFTPAAGNFEGTDPVLAEVQDGAGTNNANFATPPDGSSGRMQMFIFDFPTPERDGSLDAEIVLHELTHGTSNRLIGDGNGLIWDAGGGMGEGWSDFYALSLLNNTPTDDPNGKYASGAYATYQLAGLTDNYTYGIRRFPYSTDNTVNPLTWADVDDITYDESGGIPSSPLGFGFNGAFEVHNIGEIWANSLWEVRSRVIAAAGSVPVGNDLMLQIVTEALMMTPINPSFEDARDALIDADCAFHACAEEASIWGGFADRGLGYKAVAPLGQPGILGSGGYEGIGESFKVPYLDVQSVAVDDTLGNNNGAIDPGEPIRLTVTLFNPWRNTGQGVASAAATLTTSTAGVLVIDNTSAYPAIAAQGSAAGDTFLITVPANATCGQSLHFTVATTSTLGAGTADFVLRVGAAAGNGAPVTYTSNPNLAIPDDDLQGATATSNITDDREIADLKFRVDSLPHTFTGDLTVGLKAPNGYGTDLIYLRGIFIGDSDGDDFINTVIVEGAANDLNLSGEADAPYTGDWQPAFNGDIWSLFGIPNLFPDPVGQLASRLAGQSTQGNWKVHVTDQAFVDTGTLNSWSLIVTPKAFTCAAFASGAAVTAKKSVTGTFTQGGAITYTVTLTNNGTALQGDNAGNEFTDVLPASLTLVSASASSGAAVATLGTNTVTWNGSILPIGGTVTITINATINAPGGTSISNQGTTSFDGNNDAVNETPGVTDDPGTGTANDPTIFGVAGANVTGTKTASGSFSPGSVITYTIVLTNSAGAQADNPGNEFTDVLPASLTLIDASATSGAAVATVGTNTVTWNGALGAGASVTITIHATIHTGTAGTVVSNQGTISYDSNGDGTNDASGVTNNPATPAANDPTSVTVAGVPIVTVPTLDEVGLAALALLLAGAALFGLRRRRAA
jgi:uncharacterized repeat protein (TIGR01451 family)